VRVSDERAMKGVIICPTTTVRRVEAAACQASYSCWLPHAVSRRYDGTIEIRKVLFLMSLASECIVIWTGDRRVWKAIGGESESDSYREPRSYSNVEVRVSWLLRWQNLSMLCHVLVL
jgi:hypothetical protein